MDFKKLKNEKGITLIALAVTIVVLLILAGVTISSVFSENGIIERAKKAQETIDKAQANDLNELAKLEEQLNEYIDEIINEEEYVALNINTYFGKHQRQICDYLRMYVELSNEDEKVTFAVGTDWKDNITVESPNNLFYTKNIQMELVQDLSTDNYYVSDNSTIKEQTLNAFTNVVISNLKVKKGNTYNVKLLIQTATIDTYGNVTAEITEIYNDTIENITEETVNINIQKNELSNNYLKIFDVNGDKNYYSSDSTVLESLLNSVDKEITSYKVEALVGNDFFNVIPLLNENGKPINTDYIGFDFNRDGYISEKDAEIIMERLF